MQTVLPASRKHLLQTVPLEASLGLDLLIFAVLQKTEKENFCEIGNKWPRIETVDSSELQQLVSVLNVAETEKCTVAYTNNVYYSVLRIERI